MRCAQRKVHIWHGEVFNVDDDWRFSLAERGISAEVDWARFAGDVLVSTAPSTKCYRCELAQQRTVYFKCYVYRKRGLHKHLARPAKSAVEFWAYSRLRELQIPTLEVVAFAERRLFGRLLAGCIVTNAIHDSIDLEDFALTIWCHWPRARRMGTARAIAATLLKQARTAHLSGFFHHDLKWRNILVNRAGEPGSLVWIDAPRASRMRWRERRGVITDLSGLARIAISLFSRFELMRFLHLYLGEGGSSADAKKLFRQVQRHLGRRMPQPVDPPFPD
jgi:tRNA A-37 threonylcarbamoyl transferase component Bud32